MSDEMTPSEWERALRDLERTLHKTVDDKFQGLSDKLDNLHQDFVAMRAGTEGVKDLRADINDLAARVKVIEDERLKESGARDVILEQERSRQQFINRLAGSVVAFLIISILTAGFAMYQSYTSTLDLEQRIEQRLNDMKSP